MSLEIAVHALVDQGVDFVVIGGWAAIIHGSVYTTRDLDVCFSRSRDNLKLLAKALAPFHPRLRDLPAGLPFVWDEATLRNGTIFTLQTDVGIVDLMAELPGVGDYETVRSHSVPATAFDREVRILDLPALIKAKRAAGRPKDLQLIPELEALLEARENDPDPLH